MSFSKTTIIEVFTALILLSAAGLIAGKHIYYASSQVSISTFLTSFFKSDETIKAEIAADYRRLLMDVADMRSQFRDAYRKGTTLEKELVLLEASEYLYSRYRLRHSKGYLRRETVWKSDDESNVFIRKKGIDPFDS